MKIPNMTEAAYWAGKEIHLKGPRLPDQLYDNVDFGAKRSASLQRIVQGGWLIDLEDGRIDLCQQARDFYAGKNIGLPKKEMGSLATPREVPVFKPKAPQLRAASRGPRRDAFDNSLAAIPSHYAKVTP